MSAVLPDPTPTPDVQFIAPEQARLLLDAAIAARCGADWQDEDSGWLLVTGHDYMARLTRAGRNVDFYVDLLGVVTTDEREINDAQSSGRTLVWVLLLLILGIGYALARAIGWL